MIAFFFRQVGKPLGFFDRCGADQHRLALFGQLLNLVGNREVFFLLGAVDDVGILDAPHLLVRRNDDDFELVDLVELGCFRFGRTGHAGQLLEHAEIILEGDGRQRLVFALDLDAFFGLNRLVQAIGPAAARHHASGEFVDDDDFAVFDHVFDVSAIERVRLDRGLDVMLQRPVFRVGDVSNPEQPFDLLPTLVGDRDVAVLLVDHEVAGKDLSLRIVSGRARSLMIISRLSGAIFPSSSYWRNSFGDSSSPLSSFGMMRLTL